MDGPFVSHAQNAEDVVLWRALSEVRDGCYVDVGANDPQRFSISRAFYDRGWRGVTVEPMRRYAEQHRAERPGDTLVEAVITAGTASTVVLHEIDDTGLSTLDDALGARHAAAGWPVRDVTVAARRLGDVLDEAALDPQGIHFMTVDVEGAEADVLASVDLRRWRPWVLVVEATVPQSTSPAHMAWEPALLTAGYQLCLFDGLSRFYVAAERAAALGPALSYPACVLDDFVSWQERAVQRELEVARAELAAAQAESAATLAARQRDFELKLDAALASAAEWRHRATRAWDAQAAARRGHLEGELAALQRTVSWRVTAPLRSVRRVVPPGRVRSVLK